MVCVSSENLTSTSKASFEGLKSMKGLGGTCNSDVCAVLSAIHVKSSKKMNATKKPNQTIRTFKLKYKERRLGEPFYYELSNAIKKKGQVRTHFWVVVVQRPIIIKMAAGLSDAQIEEFREAFHLFDKNQDGTITTKDLGNVLKAIGQNPSDEETQQLMERVNYLNKVKEPIY